MTREPASRRELPIVEVLLRAVLHSVECGVLCFDAEGGAIFANERLADLLGLPAETVGDVGRLETRLAELSDNFREPSSFGPAWRARHATGERAAWEELEMLRPAHHVIRRHSRQIHDASGRRAGWIEVYREITGQRALHSKILQTEKMAAIGQLVSGIAHELNNPLTSIIGYAQLLRRRLPAERAGDAQRIVDEAARAGRIVKNLLLFARDTKPVRESVDLNEVIERTLALRSYELKVENIALDLDLAADPPAALADASQMQQVILNLVVNAEQAIQQARGSGRIRVRTARAGAHGVLLQVSDDGPGISPEFASRVFDPFFTTKEAGVGTGLGLSIVYGIVHEHGGEITLESEPGCGATFTIELPAAGATLSSRPDRDCVSAPFFAGMEPRESSVPAPAASGKRVLVVEDEPTVARLIADVLGEEGHTVEAILDSREALARVFRDNYDLVICDLRMPHLDGQAFYRALVQAGSPLQHHMVIVTGDTLGLHSMEFLERTGLPYVAKPFLVEEFKLAVQRALAHAAAVSPLPAGVRAVGSTRDAARKK